MDKFSAGSSPTPDESMVVDGRRICLALDQDVIDGLKRLQDVLGFPIGTMVSSSLRPLISSFLPLADLQEQGKLSADCLPDALKGLESLFTVTEVAKTRLTKDVIKLERQQRKNRGAGYERQDKSST